MKTIKSKFFFIFICLLEAIQTFGAPHPPPPAKEKDANGPIPPGLAIDNHLYILILLATLFGIYIIFKHHIKTKTPN